MASRKPPDAALGDPSVELNPQIALEIEAGVGQQEQENSGNIQEKMTLNLLLERLNLCIIKVTKLFSFIAYLLN